MILCCSWKMIVAKKSKLLLNSGSITLASRLGGVRSRYIGKADHYWDRGKSIAGRAIEGEFYRRLDFILIDFMTIIRFIVPFSARNNVDCH